MKLKIRNQEKICKTKSWLFEKIIKMVKSARITEKKRERTQIINIRNNTENIITDPMGIIRVIKKERSVNHSVVSYSLWPHGLQPARLLCPWDFPSKNTATGCHFLLQGIFPIQGSNLGLLHCRQILYHWVTRGSLSIGL